MIIRPSIRAGLNSAFYMILMSDRSCFGGCGYMRRTLGTFCARLVAVPSAAGAVGPSARRNVATATAPRPERTSSGPRVRVKAAPQLAAAPVVSTASPPAGDDFPDLEKLLAEAVRRDINAAQPQDSNGNRPSADESFAEANDDVTVVDDVPTVQKKSSADPFDRLADANIEELLRGLGRESSLQPAPPAQRTRKTGIAKGRSTIGDAAPTAYDIDALLAALPPSSTNTNTNTTATRKSGRAKSSARDSSKQKHRVRTGSATTVADDASPLTVAATASSSADESLVPPRLTPSPVSRHQADLQGLLTALAQLPPEWRLAAIQIPAFEVAILRDLTARLELEVADSMPDGEAQSWKKQAEVLQARLAELMNAWMPDGGVAAKLAAADQEGSSTLTPAGDVEDGEHPAFSDDEQH